ncbi:unnamed protein product [Urochloa decumbens]|uniref:Glutaredoxin domain-containing protein n=1 Tax=Urochloa decumbens TaxID=240449 RepID=A0ABC8YYI5_9POAL
MGCAGSKSNAADDVGVGDMVVYRPPPTSVSLFDISAVEEPWLIAKKNTAAAEDCSDDGEEEETTDDDNNSDSEEEEEEKKTVQVPLPLLDKLVEGYELAPASWSEVSKALEDMKPHVLGAPAPAPAAAAAAAAAPPPPPKKKKKIKKKKKKQKKQEHQQALPTLDDASTAESKPAPPELAGRRVVKDNPFLMRDRETKQQAGAGPTTTTRWKRRDPFEGCPERRPPGATGGGVVLYTTTLHGVRRTFEDCERARDLVHACAEAAGVAAVDERDVSLHADYLRELRDLLPAGEGEGEGSSPPLAPPRLFVMGRYVGGAEECAALADSGKLGEMMRWAKARGEACAAKDGRGCEGCGGARFVPCWECGGSCKVVAAGEVVERCAKCNENGLMMCPICH